MGERGECEKREKRNSFRIVLRILCRKINIFL